MKTTRTTVLRARIRLRRGVTRVEVLVVAICVSIIAATLLRQRELTRRHVCRDNVHAILTAALTYAGQNRDNWPVAAHPEATDDRVGKVEYVRAIGSYRGRAGDPQAGNTDRMAERPTHLSTTRNLWTLFRLGLITRDKFVCPSTNDVPNTEPNATDYWDFGVGEISGPATPEQSRAGYSQISYGYQVPYGKHARPSQDLWLCWLVADKGPYGAALETGTSATPPPFPAGGPPRSWRPWNSPNHGGEGQNALHVQTMVEFGEHPMLVGPDNIYTQNPGIGTANTNSHYGVPPTVNARLVPAPRRPEDTLIYP